MPHRNTGYWVQVIRLPVYPLTGMGRWRNVRRETTERKAMRLARELKKERVEVRVVDPQGNQVVHWNAP